MILVYFQNLKTGVKDYKFFSSELMSEGYAKICRKSGERALILIK